MTSIFPQRYIGDDLADQLELPATAWKHLLPIVHQRIRVRENTFGRRRRS